MAEVIQIEKDGVKQFPITIPEAIVDSNGSTFKPIIDSKSDKPIIEDVSETSVSMAISPNTIYNCTSALSDIAVTSFNTTSEGYEEYMVLFKSGSATTISLPSDVCWANGEQPEIDADTEYELSISKRVVDGANIFKAILVPFKTIE